MLSCIAAYLFPAGALIARKDADSDFSVASLRPEELYRAFNARCSRRCTRKVHTRAA